MSEEQVSKMQAVLYRHGHRSFHCAIEDQPPLHLVVAVQAFTPQDIRQLQVSCPLACSKTLHGGQ